MGDEDHLNASPPGLQGRKDRLPAFNVLSHQIRFTLTASKEQFVADSTVDCLPVAPLASGPSDHRAALAAEFLGWTLDAFDFHRIVS